MKKVVKALALMGVVILSTSAQANIGLNVVTTNLGTQMGGIVNVISSVSYIIGVALGVKAALKMKESNESKGQVPISNAIVLALVAAVLLTLPSFLKTGRETVFGSTTKGTELNGSSLQTIN